MGSDHPGRAGTTAAAAFPQPGCETEHLPRATRHAALSPRCRWERSVRTSLLKVTPT